MRPRASERYKSLANKLVIGWFQCEVPSTSSAATVRTELYELALQDNGCSRHRIHDIVRISVLERNSIIFSSTT
jgi:hypothetical protein